MHYLIDGHNLIAKSAAVALGDPKAEAELVLLLRRWVAGSRKRKVTVIFDGGLPGGENPRLSTSAVKVLFASSNKTADDLLISRIRNFGNPSEYTVVTDDRAVIAEVQKVKGIAMSSVLFTQAIDNLDRRNERAVSQGDREMSITELDEWLELFNRDQTK